MPTTKSSESTRDVRRAEWKASERALEKLREDRALFFERFKGAAETTALWAKREAELVAAEARARRAYLATA